MLNYDPFQTSLVTVMNHTTKKNLYFVFDGDPVTPIDRIWALGLAGSSQTEIAKDLGLTKATVYKTIHDIDSSYNVASKIAEVTGLTLNRLWPCGKYSTPPTKRKQPIKKAA